MSSIQTLREQAKELRLHEDYEHASDIYKQLWEATGDKWDGWGLAYCLNKLKKYEDSLKISKIVYRNEPDFHFIHSTYAWSAYMINICYYDNMDDLYTLIDYSEGILKLTDHEHDNIFRQKTILKVMDYCDKHKQWDVLLEWSRKVDQTSLSKTPYKFTKNGKNITVPSSREMWFLKTSKAYEKLKIWEKCLSISKLGLVDFQNEIWLLRRSALSEGHMGEETKAIKELHDLAMKKSDWFIYRDIAVLYEKLDDFENALLYIAEACLAAYRKPDPEYIWEIYYEAALYLHKTNNNEQAKKHLDLSYSLRHKEGWKTPEVLNDLSESLGVQLKFIEDTKSVLIELSDYWTSLKNSQKTRYSGHIKTILPNGRAGFIKSKDGTDYYFRLNDYKGNRNMMVEGTNVEYFLEDSFDRVKQTQSMKATEITPIPRDKNI